MNFHQTDVILFTVAVLFYHLITDSDVNNEGYEVFEIIAKQVYSTNSKLYLDFFVPVIIASVFTGAFSLVFCYFSHKRYLQYVQITAIEDKNRLRKLKAMRKVEWERRQGELYKQRKINYFESEKQRKEDERITKEEKLWQEIEKSVTDTLAITTGNNKPSS